MSKPLSYINAYGNLEYQDIEFRAGDEVLVLYKNKWCKTTIEYSHQAQILYSIHHIPILNTQIAGT